MYRVLFVGSNPSVKSGSTVPFWHDAKSTRTLDKWMETVWTKCGYFKSIHFLNVMNGVTPNNRPLTTAEINASLPYLIQDIKETRADKVIALGRTAEKALTKLGIEFFAMPHPSGLNRKLNDPKYIEEKINGLAEYLLEPVQNTESI